MPLEEFVARPIQIAVKLGDGVLGGTYLEAGTLLSGVMSGMASFVWPGRGIDRKRFVELWVRSGAMSRVSLPLLIAALRTDAQSRREIERLRPKLVGPGNDVRVVTGSELDLAEFEVQTALPNMTLAAIRKYSYPCAFYEHVRSALAHEYELGDRASAWPMTSRTEVDVSYANHMGHGRQIHFHVPWLATVVAGAARAADGLVAGGLPPTPTRWWLDG